MQHAWLCSHGSAKLFIFIFPNPFTSCCRSLFCSVTFLLSVQTISIFLTQTHLNTNRATHIRTYIHTCTFVTTHSNLHTDRIARMSDNESFFTRTKTQYDRIFFLKNSMATCVCWIPMHDMALVSVGDPLIVASGSANWTGKLQSSFPS